jgi:hypothetical protein
MSQSYLDKFRSKLPTVQGNQILKALVSKRDSGEIRTVDEFKARLKELTAELLVERITPTFKLWTAIPGTDISSAQYNDMLDHIENDLEAAFAEADNIDEVVAAHHNIINNVALKALRFGVNQLESQVSLYEFLNKSGQGFDAAQFNTFRESQNQQTTRSDSIAPLVFVDPKQAAALQSEDATVDFLGERLILGTEAETLLTLKDATWLANENSIRSELDASFQNSKITNVIDNRNNTFWVIPILLSQVRTSGVPMELCITLSATQDVNFVEIEPVSRFPMVLTGIDYYDANNQRQSVSAVSSVTLNRPMRINFGRITASRLVLRLRQDNYQEVQFTKTPGESNFHRALLQESQLEVDAESINEDLQELLTSEYILSDVLALPSTADTRVKYFEYVLGFDNVRAGYSVFIDKSIFVSSKKTVQYPGQVALRVDEVRPVQVSGSTLVSLENHTYPARDSSEDARFYHGVAEYWLAIQLFTEDNFLISTDVIPIPPLGAYRLYHEQLYFRYRDSSSTTDDIAQLNLYAAADSTDVLVYRNSTLLEYGTDWEFVSVGHTSGATVTSPGTGKPMKRAIRVLSAPQTLDIYTVSYTPVVSNTKVLPNETTLLQVVDMTGDQTIRITNENILVFEPIRNSHSIAKADVYLMALLRRNSADQNFSPALEEYMLVVGSKDASKFAGD